MIIVVIGVAVIAFIAGLLVGRKNPKLADTAQSLADKVGK